MRGQLLVATPDLQDLNFSRTVVLVLEHSPEGALGVVLNRPSDTPLRDALPEWSLLSPEPSVVFFGGPVQPESAIALGRRAGTGEGGTEGTDEGSGFAALFGGLGTVDLERAPEDVGEPVDRVRVFAGYAGWGPGQLEGELEANGWFVVDADRTDAWSSDPESLWRTVLRRQRGPLRVFANFPADPSSN